MTLRVFQSSATFFCGRDAFFGRFIGHRGGLGAAVRADDVPAPAAFFFEQAGAGAEGTVEQFDFFIRIHGDPPFVSNFVFFSISFPARVCKREGRSQEKTPPAESAKEVFLFLFHTTIRETAFTRALLRFSRGGGCSGFRRRPPKWSYWMSEPSISISCRSSPRLLSFASPSPMKVITSQPSTSTKDVAGITPTWRSASPSPQIQGLIR